MPVRQRACEAVHEPTVKRKLFVSVSVILVAGIGDTAIDSEWIHSVGVVREQASALDAVDARGIIFRASEVLRAVIILLGVRIGSKVMIERNVLLEDHHNMLDRRLRGGAVFVLCRCRVHRKERHRRSGHNSQSSSKTLMHRKSLLGILSLETQIEIPKPDALAGRRGLEAVTACFPAHAVLSRIC